MFYNFKYLPKYDINKQLLNTTMNKVHILIKGYAKRLKNGWKASSTCTLIESGQYNIIVDPGVNRMLLLSRLKKRRLSTSRINYVYLTHYHLDHTLLAGIFEKAKILDDQTIFENDKETDYEGTIPHTDIQVISTRGHAAEHSSLLIPTKDGIVAVAGDVFWWTDEEKQISSDRTRLLNRKDPFVKNKRQLRASRLKVLNSADVIIPGHGKQFFSPKS